MESHVTALITDEQGWQKPCQLGEGVHWVGTAENAHIQLPNAEGIAPYHLQIINSISEASVRLVNLSATDMFIENSDEVSTFSPGGILDVFGAELLHIGSYSLQFEIEKQEIQKQSTKEQKKQVMGARLALPDVVLRPDMPLIANLALQNSGDEACQFEVEITGLPEECYQSPPPPLIFAGGEENTEIRIMHRKTAPEAGNHTLTLRVSAPDIYPGEELTLRQSIKVLPYYEHKLSFAPLESELPHIEETIPEAAPDPIAQAGEKIIDSAAQDKTEQTGPDDVSQSDVFILPTEPETPVSPHLEELPLKPPIPPVEDTAPPIADTEPVEPLSGNITAQPEAEAADNHTEFIEDSDTFSQTDELVNAVESGKDEAALDLPSETQEDAELADDETIAPIEIPVRKPKRPDLSSVKVIKANTGDFLKKRAGKP